MNQSRKIITALIILLSAFVSCEKVLETDVKISSKLCFNCILNPDSTIKGSLSLCKSISDVSEIKKIDNAMIELKKDGIVLSDYLNKEKGIYTWAVKPVKGSLYEISIRVNGYPTLLATTIIPEKPNVTYAKSTPRLETGHGIAQNYLYDVTYTISDKQGTNRYWTYSKSKTNGVWRFTGGYGGVDSPFFDDFNKEVDATYINGFFYDYYLRINDFGFDGKSISFQDTYNTNHVIELFFMDADEHYDKYMKSSIKQMINDDDLLFNEPVQIYSNIENGLGIFGSVAITSFKL